MGNDGLGKKAEKKIKEWLDHPELGYSFDRIPDQLSGFYGSRNICDFTLFKSPLFFYIESKATWRPRFDFDMISEYQMTHLLEKSHIENVWSIIIVLFATEKRAFILNIQDIQNMIENGHKSLSITKIKKWPIPYIEIPTVANSRKELLDYTGRIEDLILDLSPET